jgi:hypothetical protein
VEVVILELLVRIYKLNWCKIFPNKSYFWRRLWYVGYITEYFLPYLAIIMYTKKTSYHGFTIIAEMLQHSHSAGITKSYFRVRNFWRAYKISTHFWILQILWLLGWINFQWFQKCGCMYEQNCVMQTNRFLSGILITSLCVKMKYLEKRRHYFVSHILKKS